MADRSILMSPPMVRAILREIDMPGTGKTQTRRFLDAWCDEPPAYVWSGQIVAEDEAGHMYRWPRTHAVGDRLLVGEAWRAEARYDHLPPRDIPVGSLVSYEADYDREPNDGCRGRLRLGRFLPYWARRLVPTVTSVRVERLQDISEADARAEGVFVPEAQYAQQGSRAPVLAYGALWTDLNGEGAWDANPWVAAYTLAPERRAIDFGGRPHA